MSKPPSFRIFETRPTKLYITEAREHILTTGQPETLASLFQGPISKDEPHEILDIIKIAKNLRPEGDMVPCPMCVPDKFYDGRLCWFPNLRCVAFIGNCCAKRDISVAAYNKFKKDNLKFEEESYLLSILPTVPAKINTLLKAKAFAHDATQIHKNLKIGLGSAHAHLNKICKSGGLLTVVEETALELRATGVSDYRKINSGRNSREINFGRLQGHTALLSTYNPEQEVQQIYLRLSKCNFKNDNLRLEFIAGLSNKERHDYTVLLKEADRAFRKYEDRLRDFISFFSTDNLRCLDSWGSHPNCPTPFRINIDMAVGYRRISIKGFKDYFLPDSLRKGVGLDWPKPS